MASLNELIIALGFDVKSESFQKLSSFVGGVDAIARGFETLGKNITGNKGFKDFLLGVSSKAQNLINLSNTIGMSTDSIQQWQYAAEKAGVSAQSVIGDITQLTTKWRKNQNGVLALAKQIQNASPFMVQAYKNMYGLSDDMITLMRRGPEEIKRYMKEIKENGGIISEEDLKKGKDFQESLNQVKATITNTTQSVATQFMPKMQEMADGFSRWIKDTDNQTKALNGLKTVLMGLAASSVISAISTFVVNIALVTKAVKALTVASYGLMKSPLGVIFAAIGAAKAGWDLAGDMLEKHLEKNKGGALAHALELEMNNVPGKNQRKKEEKAPKLPIFNDKQITYKPKSNALYETLTKAETNTNTTTTNNNVSVFITTDQTGSALRDSILQYTGMDINNASMAYNQEG